MRVTCRAHQTNGGGFGAAATAAAVANDDTNQIQLPQSFTSSSSSTSLLGSEILSSNPSLRSTSSSSATTTSGPPHYVDLHVSAGECVSLQLLDGQEQVVAGPATITMISQQQTPPVPIPVQVPHGHMIHQIADENGTLKHIILSVMDTDKGSTMDSNVIDFPHGSFRVDSLGELVSTVDGQMYGYPACCCCCYCDPDEAAAAAAAAVGGGAGQPASSMTTDSMIAQQQQQDVIMMALMQHDIGTPAIGRRSNGRNSTNNVSAYQHHHHQSPMMQSGLAPSSQQQQQQQLGSQQPPYHSMSPLMPHSKEFGRGKTHHGNKGPRSQNPYKQHGKINHHHERASHNNGGDQNNQNNNNYNHTPSYTSVTSGSGRNSANNVLSYQHHHHHNSMMQSNLATSGTQHIEAQLQLPQQQSRHPMSLMTSHNKEFGRGKTHQSSGKGPRGLNPYKQHGKMNHLERNDHSDGGDQNNHQSQTHPNNAAEQNHQQKNGEKNHIGDGNDEKHQQHNYNHVAASRNSVGLVAPTVTPSSVAAAPVKQESPPYNNNNNTSSGSRKNSQQQCFPTEPSPKDTKDAPVSQDVTHQVTSPPAQIRRSGSAGDTSETVDGDSCVPAERTQDAEPQMRSKADPVEQQQPQSQSEEQQQQSQLNLLPVPQSLSPSLPPSLSPPPPQPIPVQKLHESQQQNKTRKQQAAENSNKRNQDNSSSLIESARSCRGKQKKSQKDDTVKRSRQQRAVEEPSVPVSGDKESMLTKDAGQEGESSIKVVEPVDNNKLQAHQEKQISKRENTEQWTNTKLSEPKSSSPSSKAKDSPNSESLDQSQKSGGNKQVESFQSSAKPHVTKMTSFSPPNRGHHHHQNNHNHHNHNHHHHHHVNNQQQSIKVSNLLKQCRNKFVTNMGKLVQNSLSSYSDTKFAGLILIIFTMFATLLAIFIHYYIIAPVNGS